MRNETSGLASDLATRVKIAVDAKPDLREMLFPFGFLVTSKHFLVPLDGFPFYGRWREDVIGRYRFLIHPEQKLYRLAHGDVTHFLIGHAYDPFAMVSEEPEILEGLAAAHVEGPDQYLHALNKLTGIFVVGHVSGEEILVVCDAMAMQTAFYGQHLGATYVASHSSIIGELCKLEKSAYIQRLVSYRFYHLFGKTLPTDLSPYEGIRRLLPNHQLRLTPSSSALDRIFPLSPLPRADSRADYEQTIAVATRILKASMALVAQKWGKPAISLTGGCDSQTTLTAAEGQYDRFRYFSYVSSPEEQVDAEAAKGICTALGLPHEVITVPVDEIAKRDDFKAICAILELNHGDIGPVSKQETAKRIVLRESSIGVEVKSWVSEVARAYFHKRFSKRILPKRPTARYLTTLYKVFAHDRGLVRQTDSAFQDYLDIHASDGVLERVDWWDLAYWECNGGAGNGFAITGVHRFSFAIDIPYNNRLLLQTLLAAPLAARIEDQVHRDIRELANPEINQLGVNVVNVKHTRARSYAERAYLEVHSRLPF